MSKDIDVKLFAHNRGGRISKWVDGGTYGVPNAKSYNGQSETKSIILKTPQKIRYTTTLEYSMFLGC